MPADPLKMISPDVRIGSGVSIRAFVNLYGCTIGAHSRIGAFVEIQRGASIGLRCKVSSHTFICEGVIIEDEVFIGHAVTFTNDRWPRACSPGGELKTERDWTCESTVVGRGASIGSGSTILPGVRIGADAMIGAGSVVTCDVPPGAVVAGNPARTLKPRSVREDNHITP